MLKKYHFFVIVLFVTDNLSRCDYMQTYLPKSEFPSLPNGWFYPYDSILQPLFDKYLLELFETGVFNKVLNNFHTKKLDCPVEDYAKVELSFIIVIFYAFLGGVFLSLLTFLFERNGVEFFKKDFKWP